MTWTPWGQSDGSTRYARGIVFYDTPSHGGFHLTPSREAELDERLAAIGTTAEEARMGYEPGWYEEDCCAFAVLYAWPELFPGVPVADKGQGAADRLLYWLEGRRSRSIGL